MARLLDFILECLKWPMALVALVSLPALCQALHYFQLDNNKKADEFIKLLFLKENITVFSEKCCIVKNTHHIQGELTIVKNNNPKDKKFSIISMGKKESEMQRPAEGQQRKRPYNNIA